MNLSDRILLGLFLILLASVALGAWQVRATVLNGYAPDQDNLEWQKWQQETERQAAGEGPVQRTVNNSPLPPAYVLLRDHFAACLVGILVTSSVFIGVTLWLVRGAFLSNNLPLATSRPQDSQPVSTDNETT